MSVRTAPGLLAAVVLGLVLTTAGTAAAHIQVTPSIVAPGDSVQFTVLVPGERDTGTTKVELRLPDGLMPFSFEDVPGWKRRVVRTGSGEAQRIVWTGRAAPDGLVRFTFLAGTPERPTTMRWKALQTYADGHVARWIGAADAEYPAAVTEVRADAARQNAGGEGVASTVSAGPSGAAGPGSGTAAADAPGSGGTVRSGNGGASATDGGGSADWVARGIAAVALAVGLAVGGTLIVRRGDRRR